MPPPEKPDAQRRLYSRDRVAQLVALATIGFMACGLLVTKGLNFLQPGPLSSAHGAIDSCSSCHTSSGSNKLNWVHGLIAGDPAADSKACLSCHKMPKTAMNAHSASAEVLKQSTVRLTKLAATLSAPLSAQAQSMLFPGHDGNSDGLVCATCHQEHGGAKIDMKTMSNEQCRSCHVLKFDSFERDHPKFENYPFDRRTRIVFDHAGHFGKHYPEVAKKNTGKNIPETCVSCHDSQGDRRLMSIKPFEQTCATCHLDQITGKERVSGPKGIAFLSLPGLDVETLKKKKIPIGEWPEASEAELTPFMKIIIGRTNEGRKLIDSLAGLSLQDLAQANDQQLKSVNDTVWQIKRLFHALISGKAVDALAGLRINNDAPLRENRIADLTASIPRDVVISAQRQWLPNLAAEIANGPGAVANATPADPPSSDPSSGNSPEPSAASEDQSTEAAASDGPAEPETPVEAESETKAAVTAPRDPPTCVVRVFGSCLVSKGQEAQQATTAEPSGTAAAPADGQISPSLAPPMQAGLGDVRVLEKSELVVAQAADPKPSPRGAASSDDLLFPTDAELREMKAQGRSTDRIGGAGGPAAAAGTSVPAAASGTAAPSDAAENALEPENWADDGGWYTQDNAVFYRPTGHKDRFISSWLALSGPHAVKDAATPAAGVFAIFTGKDAQGSCTKCHSVDESVGKTQIVNFSPLKIADKQESFTRFVHEPHLGISDRKGCLTCHDVEKASPYLKSYEQGDPLQFAAGFGSVKKATCTSCHAPEKARQDCLLCHKYHLNGVATPVMQTKIIDQAR